MTTAEQMPDLPPLSLLDDEGTRGFSVADMLNYARAYAAQEVAREREACAKVCESNVLELHGLHSNFLCAHYIRARNA